MNEDEAGQAPGFWGLLTDAERESLRAAGRVASFSPGATMIAEGEAAASVFILVEGWVRIVSVDSAGHETVLALRGRGDVIGEAGIAGTGPRTATVRASGPVRSLIVANDRFVSFLDSNPGAAGAYRRVITRRWNDAASMPPDRSAPAPAQRLAVLLLDIAGRHGTQTQDGIVVEMPLTQEELASLAGVSRAAVTRAVSSWRSRGVIRTGRRSITITDPAALENIAGQHAGSGSPPR